ncbi:MAG: hypothetical protein AAF557_28345 [Pseudomonadota bacterium]
MSTTPVETWAGVDISQIGPLYPMVGSEFLLVVIGVVFWLGFHVLQARIEKREFEQDDAEARNPERLKRVFDEEARARVD